MRYGPNGPTLTDLAKALGKKPGNFWIWPSACGTMYVLTETVYGKGEVELATMPTSRMCIEKVIREHKAKEGDQQ